MFGSASSVFQVLYTSTWVGERCEEGGECFMAGKLRVLGVSDWMREKIDGGGTRGCAFGIAGSVLQMIGGKGVLVRFMNHFLFWPH